MRKLLVTLTLILPLVLLIALLPITTHAPPTQHASADPVPPSAPVKLIFIHHSTGENWLADGNGGLGLALRANNYFVSDTNYGWGLGRIGDTTDIGHWWRWFQGPSSAAYTADLFAESGQHAAYSRLAVDPGGANTIIMVKSCFPNSALMGNPTDPPTTGANPLRGQDAYADAHTVANAKGIYTDLLAYFAAHQEKLFVVISAPPLSDGTYAANARAFNNWLMKDWLTGYAHANVAVFDFYNVLTSNGGSATVNDLGQAGGNHHRWWNGAVQHVADQGTNTAAYPSDGGDDHPSQAGNLKATGEFVPLLNLFYARWVAGQTPQDTPTPTPTPSPTVSVIPTLDKHVQLPMVQRNFAPPTTTATATPTIAPQPGRILPSDLTYLGAFRLPTDGPDEIGWKWSGEALAYHAGGDPSGPDDGFPGSLYGTGHNWNQYVSEVSIPAPVISAAKNVEDLNRATTLQPFTDLRAGLGGEILRAGLAVLPPQGSQTTGKLYFTWGEHMQFDIPALPSHGWSELNLAAPNLAGPWRIADHLAYVTSDYLLPIPADWAAANTPGQRLATGRFRDGGQGTQGPSLLAIGPWTQGNPPPPGTSLPSTPLLLYDDVTVENGITLNGYHHADEWSGAAWMTAAGNRGAVVFVGTKGVGDCWYGFANGVVWPDGPPFPPIPDPPNDVRGWWSSQFAGRILFYDPADLAAVAQGTLAANQPQPYATMDLDAVLFHVTGDQQKAHLGAADFDPDRGLLYIMEPLADDERSVIHVWRVQ